MEDIVVVDNPKPYVWAEIVDRTAETEGWAVSDNDYNVWKGALGDDFVLRVYMTKDGKFVCSLATATYQSSISDVPLTTVGMFYTNSEFRNKGYGTQLFQELVDRPEIEGHNKGLVGVDSMAAKYASRHGFSLESDFLLDCYITPGTDIHPENLQKDPTVTTTVYDGSHFEKVNEYDKTIVPNIDRSGYVKSCLQVLKAYSVFAQDNNGKVTGYIRARTCANQQLYIGPLYADTPAIAETLLKSIFEGEELHRRENPREIPLKAANFTKFVISTPSTNKNFVDLWSKLIGYPAVRAGIMHSQFTKKILKVPTDRVYGIFDYCMSYA
ncbi:unnamed protein product [Bursaphelenchus okinawaensis]|uniref:N-acetyltransferase domain-containing protein n=1 Tax=Bursaphelenchus okinawaensis TaxID=465554 RepID=A0A811K9D5_9BILA|nr:unnamed protein product [Bursaphelenchus okinawaensis]CAG9097578.1 unnamed protein product [Bursaphelenchus okinawaensis]